MNAGGVFDQAAYLCYLPRGAIGAIRAILERVRREWPTADELIALFTQRHQEQRTWGLQWAAIAQHSDLLCINESTDQGERPLHTAVREAQQGLDGEGILPVRPGSAYDDGLPVRKQASAWYEELAFHFVTESNQEAPKREDCRRAFFLERSALHASGECGV